MGICHPLHGVQPQVAIRQCQSNLTVQASWFKEHLKIYASSRGTIIIGLGLVEKEKSNYVYDIKASRLHLSKDSLPHGGYSFFLISQANQTNIEKSNPKN
mmetsp:Transcript_8087/g.14582  ORF Transcript_8087/g.14582 Transcript_8087/m.14582 type:complete len:100 (-) Transcript_8087:500-799(-)